VNAIVLLLALEPPSAVYWPDTLYTHGYTPMPSRRAEIALTPAEQEQLLREGWTLQVASIGPKGYPHLVAIWYVVIDGHIHFTTFARSQKVLNLRRNPKITVMLESGKLYHELKGLVVEGQAEILEDTPFTARVMGLVGEKYSGIPAPMETPEAALKVAAKRVTIRVRPVDTYSWDHAKLGGRY
jgi:nitroimidazol reductase NimA-like FMN-containing flavoprotein (pyridoxamine 5'-phosphate oxidase superfamily)